MPVNEFTDSISDASAALHSGKITSVQLVQTFLQRIRNTNDQLGSFIEIMEDTALEQAEQLDDELHNGHDRGLLHGIPLSVKDLFNLAGTRTTAGSRLLASSELEQHDAPVIENLRQSGAIFIGKNNMEEFAAGLTGHNMAFGDMHNPWNVRFSAGGSSGGTAVAVASGMCLGGIGSDTGGSIRFPASVCGVVGVRPTRGLINPDGIVPRSVSLDAVGPIALTVDDAAAMLKIMGGTEQISTKEGGTQNGQDRPISMLEGMHIATIENFTFLNIDPEINACLHACLSILEKSGAEITTVCIPQIDDFLDHHNLMTILLYEFRRDFLARYEHIYDEEKVGPTVRNDLEIAKDITEERYVDSLAARDALVQETRRVFKGIDALLTPTQPMRVPLLTDDPAAFSEARRFLLPTSFIGWPSISVPCGRFLSGLPLGVQIIGDYFQEETIFHIAKVIQEQLWQRS